MSISEIVDTLQQQHKLYEQLLEMELTKKQFIMNNDILPLNGLTQKERLVTAEAEKLELTRTRLTTKYFKDIGFRFRSGVLSELIKAVSNADEKDQLLHLHGKLVGLLVELKRANDLNQQLIRQSLDFIEFSIDLMLDDPTEDVVYQHPMNQLAGNKRKKMFDSRA